MKKPNSENTPINDQSCHVCGHHNFKKLYPVTDTNQGVPGTWDIIECQNCGLGILNPLPTADEISSYYQDSFYSKDEQKRFIPFVEFLRQTLGRLRTRGLRKMFDSPGRILDYGAGAGHFIDAMQSIGWEVASVDIANQEESRSQCRGLVVMDGERPRIEYPDNYFDAVSLWYVIEHVLSPRATIEEIRRVLKPDGVLLLAQQDFSSLQASIFGPAWLILDPPRHLFQFNASNLSQLCNELGFSFEKIERASIEMGPFTILQSLLNRLLGNKNYLFRFMKSGELRNPNGNLNWGTKEKVIASLSLALTIILGPLSVLSYFVLLAFGQSDVFTSYFRLKNDIN